MLEEALLGAVVARAGEAGEEEEHGDFVQGVEGRGGWEEEVQCHVAGGGFGGVAQLQELPAEGGDGGFGLEGHGVGEGVVEAPSNGFQRKRVERACQR